MKKSDLKVGYLVKFRNGAIKMVMPTIGQTVFVDEKGTWMGSNDYDDDLKCLTGSDYDIVKVLGYTKFACDSIRLDEDDREILLEEKREMTISEIEKELGYPIKIVKED